MRIKEIFITTAVLALSLTTLASMVHSTQYQQAAVAESRGFDALAHDLFGHDGIQAPAGSGGDAR